MNKPMLCGLATVMTILTAGAARAEGNLPAQALRHQMLPQLYVGETIAQAACPDDQVVWVNWSARRSHLPTDKWYGHTDTGAYACAAMAAKAGIKPAS